MVLEFCSGGECCACVEMKGSHIGHGVGTLQQKIDNKHFQMTWADHKFDFAYDIAVGMVRVACTVVCKLIMLYNAPVRYVYLPNPL